METIVFKTRGVCSSEIKIEVEDGKVVHAAFRYGCDGNLAAVCKLVEGLPVEKVIEKLKGIDCEGKGTSCPDQLARALEEYAKGTGKTGTA